MFAPGEAKPQTAIVSLKGSAILPTKPHNLHDVRLGGGTWYRSNFNL